MCLPRPQSVEAPFPFPNTRSEGAIIDITHIKKDARVYKIVWDQGRVEELSKELGYEGEPHAICHHIERVIYLAPKPHRSIVAVIETLTHEVLHICEPFVGRHMQHDYLDALALNLVGCLVNCGLINPSGITIAGWTEEMLAAQAE